MPRRVEVDISGVREIDQDFTVARRLLLVRLGERGEKHLLDEVPSRSGNLKKGVSPPEYDQEKGTATLTVSAARDADGSLPATVHYPSGKTKVIALRPQLAFNYAEVVARGNREPVVRPQNGRVFLIPVVTPPAGEAYLTTPRGTYIVRRSHKAMKPNPFDERAAVKVEREAVSIASALFGERFG